MSHPLIRRFAAEVERRPRAVALVWRRTEITYRELHDSASAAFTGIRALDLRPGAAVGVLAAKTPDTIAVILALLADRRPVLVPSPGLGAEALAALFRAAGCVTVVGTEDTDLVEHVLPTSGDPAAQLPTDGDDDDIGFMFTTSGSTGLPKVVPQTTAATARFMTWAAQRFHIGAGATVLNYAPLNFDLCLLDIWTTLATGGRVVLVEPDQATRAEHLLDLLLANDVDVVQAVPMFFQLLAGLETRQVPGVTQLISTGDTLPPQRLADVSRLFPNATVYNLYGCTETNDSFLHVVNTMARDGLPIPIGRPITGVEAVLVDRDGSEVLGTGVGELYVRTPYQGTGYLGDEVRTAERFVPGPGGRAGPFFRSGDLVRREIDGSLTLQGRTDFQVKVRGVRINVQEVERILLAHAEVVEAVVLSRPDPLAGRSLHAVVHRRDAALNTLLLRKHCAARLPRQAVPSSIHLIDTPLPRTASGKPDRARIAHDYV